jgi:class 3 adenylate cyclase
LPDEVVIVVSEAVVDEAGPGFLFEELGEVAIQGRNSRIRAFALLGPAPGSGTAGHEAEEDAASASP